MKRDSHARFCRQAPAPAPHHSPVGSGDRRVAAIAGPTAQAAPYPEYPYDATDYNEPFRGQFHFSSQGGWMNDVNAPLYYNGTYHLFYQHNPHGLHWDTMHWGHATSTDLVHWAQQPIALEPGTHNATLFSGGGWVDTANVTGLKTGADAPILLFTNTDGVSIAYSTDGARTFRMYDGGAKVISTPFESRDPKVFWDAARERWGMVFWGDEGGNVAKFYSSTNLLDWTYGGEFRADWLFECPDLYQLPVDGNTANPKWVLQDASGEYVVGALDSAGVFVPDAGWSQPQRLDVGRTSFDGTAYAGLTFTNMPDDRVIQMFWQPGNNRRRGILTALMRRQLDDVAERGEPMAILTASEAVIYPRDGYGLASQYAGVEIDTRRAAFDVPVRDTGRLRLVDKEEAAKIQPPLFDAYRRTRPGELSRSDRFWEVIFLDRERWRDGFSAHFHVVHETEGGEADGYARYRVKEEWDDSGPASVVGVMEAIGADPEVEAALWRYLFELDLVRKAKCFRRPVDDWLRWRLADGRTYRTTHLNDWLWVRPLDTVVALSARRYATEGSLVLEVADAFRPDGAAAGRFQLDGAPDGASCARLDVAGPDADLSLDVVALGAAYLGGVSFRSLAEAGRVHGDPAAIARADALFASTPLPFCSTPF